MYFDFFFYRRVLAFTWSQKDWPGRRVALLRLLLVVPLLALLHSLFFLLDYVFFPRLWTQAVHKPVFIVGHARSGTTLIHRLMAGDAERFSFILYWETFFPALTERAVIRALGRLDRWALGGYLRRRIERWDEKTFAPWRHIHEQGLWIPEEDLFVMRAAFMPQPWTLLLPLSHQLDIFHIDALSPRRRRRWLRHYRECVKRQLVQFGGDRIHLSKNPLMCGWVAALLEEFPDARFIVMMRHPQSCIPSTLKLVTGSWRAKGWSPAQYQPALEALKQICIDSFRLPAAVLAEHPTVPQVVVDYRDLTARPVDVLDEVYTAFDLPLDDTYRQRLLERESREKAHSTHFRYTLEEFDLRPEDLQRELQEFYTRFNWPGSVESKVSTPVEAISSDSYSSGESQNVG